MSKSFTFLFLCFFSLTSRASDVRTLQLTFPWNVRLSDAFTGKTLSDEFITQVPDRLKIEMVFHQNESTLAPTPLQHSKLARAEAASQWAYQNFAGIYPRFKNELQHLANENLRLAENMTMIYAPDNTAEFVRSRMRNPVSPFLGTTKLIYARANGEIPVLSRAHAEYRPARYTEPTYPLFDVQSGRIREISLDVENRAVGPPAQIAEVNGIYSDVFPGLLIAMAIDVSRRALDPTFQLPSEFVLLCPAENIPKYESVGFKLVGERPLLLSSRKPVSERNPNLGTNYLDWYSPDTLPPDLYTMRIHPRDLMQGVALALSHRRGMQDLREAGFRMEGDFGSKKVDTWIFDRRISKFEILRHRLDRIKRQWFGPKKFKK